MKTPRIYSKLTTSAAPLFVGLLLSASAVFAADEICSSCGPDVRVNGEFVHRKDNASVTIQGAPADNAAAFREEINGKNFNITIGHLPAGRYTISIGEVETLASAAGERVFDVMAGDVALAKNFDIFAAAGGKNKALVREFPNLRPDRQGQIAVRVTTTPDSPDKNAKISAIEILEADQTSAARAPDSGVRCRDQPGLDNLSGGLVQDLRLLAESRQLTAPAVRASHARRQTRTGFSRGHDDQERDTAQLRRGRASGRSRRRYCRDRKRRRDHPQGHSRGAGKAAGGFAAVLPADPLPVVRRTAESPERRGRAPLRARFLSGVSPAIPVMDPLPGAAMGRLFGRDFVVHVAK